MEKLLIANTAFIGIVIAVFLLLIIAIVIMSKVSNTWEASKILLNKLDKLEDSVCIIKLGSMRIEKRCDAIDQRTKAHLVTKKKSIDKNNKSQQNNKQKTGRCNNYEKKV